MSELDHLEEEISRFLSWDKPWEFESFVVENRNLNEDALRLFNEIWQFVLEDEHWEHENLGSCVQHVSKALRLRFPSIGAESSSIICKAAAYQWQ